MTRITVDVDDERAKELIDYLNSLAYAKVAEDDIPEWQKEEVRHILRQVEEGKMETYALKESLDRAFKKK